MFIANVITILPRRLYVLNRQVRSASMLQRRTPNFVFADDRAAVEQVFFRPLDCGLSRDRRRLNRRLWLTSQLPQGLPFFAGKLAVRGDDFEA